MLTVGLLLRIEAKPDQAEEVEAMLKSAVDHVRHETATVVWFAFRLGPTTFGVFDASVDEANRQAHLDANSGALSGELAARLFAESPSVEKVDVIAAKLPAA
ncbi:antibiotic biosynthesis monooxygenase [Catenulispora yoronensis]|uniref:Antibiotic biosynthesis monooxygenase n=1 Tax=Catenulispora yoronensis TaxID=450799 RepID=A0ABN2TJ99_9ACTN